MCAQLGLPRLAARDIQRLFDQGCTDPFAASGLQNADAADLGGVVAEVNPGRANRFARQQRKKVKAVGIKAVDFLFQRDALFVHEYDTPQVKAGIEVVRRRDLDTHLK